MEFLIADLDTGDTLTATEVALRAKRSAEADILQLAAHWADLHPGVRPASFGTQLGEQQVQLGGDGTPLVGEFASAELAASLEIHPLGARSLIADVQDLRYRLPSLWRRVTVDLVMPDWVARRVASMTRGLTLAQVAEIDRRLAADATGLPPSRLFTLVEAMVVAADNKAAEDERADALAQRFVTISDHQSRPGTTGVYGCVDNEGGHRLEATISQLADNFKAAGNDDPVDVRRAKALVLLGNPALALKTLLGLEPDLADPDLAEAIKALPAEKLAPAATLYLHTTDTALAHDESGVARAEGLGALTLAQLIEILGHSHVTVRPVIDLNARRSSDAYEFTGDLREAVLLTTPADCYPYAGAVTRKVDLDHTREHNRGGPTDTNNAGPMVRHHHRIKTFGPMDLRQPAPGTYLWRTRHGRYLMTNQCGTHPVDPSLGRAIFDKQSAMEYHFATIVLANA